ncbi:PRC-barrel domain-containing protein [Skermanella mucosa]|uniref:PRC-barrel domain-containing protein n=1 Tax=Skermanella mucosa TaxID=1789672 RepID=UPI00192B09F4|nr:PRC-barrel domain-containing protein [Skermanella mucosa]UEM18582.1 PRC-barrel domain-containing protein [Skermanella mucosa]
MTRPMLSLLMVAMLGATQSAAAQDPVSPPREEPVAVGDYSYDDFYTGFRLSRLIGLPVVGGGEKPVGTIADVTIGFPGELEWVVIQPGAAAPPMEGGRFSLGWNMVEVNEGFETAEIPLNARNLRETAPGQPIGPVERPESIGRQWHVSELVGSALEIDGDVPVGTVDDIIAGGDAALKAVVFRDDEAGTLRAVPWRSVVVEPGGRILTVPLTEQVIAGLPAFDYAKMTEALPD